MKHQRANRAMHNTWIYMAAPWVGAVLTAMLTAGLWFRFVKDGSLKIVLFAAPMIIVVGVITLWQQSRIRTRMRNAMWNRYADNEIARASLLFDQREQIDHRPLTVVTIT